MRSKGAQIALALEGDPLELYIGGTWSGLSPDGRDDMLTIIRGAEELFRRRGFVVCSAIRKHPPGARSGEESQRLWLELREEMARSHLFLAVYAGPSVGLVNELNNAATYVVPTILVVKAGVNMHELGLHPAINPLVTIRYLDSADAARAISKYLNDEGERVTAIAEVARLRYRLLGEGAKKNQLGFFMDRAGMDERALAQQTGISEVFIRYMAKTQDMGNPASAQSLAVAQALGVSVGSLLEGHDDWATNEFQRKLIGIADEDDWSVREIKQFVTDYRGRDVDGLSKSDLRRHMRQWRSARA